MVSGRIRLANGRISFVRTCRISVVPSLAAAISAVGPTLLINVWTVSIIPIYIMWHWRALGHPWGPLPDWVMLLEYGCVATAGA